MSPRSPCRLALMLLAASLPFAAGAVPGGGRPADGRRPVTKVPSVLFRDLGDARRVVFVCDGTGTMVNKQFVLRHDLMRAVNALAEGRHEYRVIFFTDNGKVLTEKVNGLLAASAANRKATADWVEDIAPSGTTDPVPSLQAAFALKPDLVYFLSDGEFNNLRSYQEIREEVAKGAGKATRVNTILYETMDPEAAKNCARWPPRPAGRTARCGSPRSRGTDRRSRRRRAEVAWASRPWVAVRGEGKDGRCDAMLMRRRGHRRSVGVPPTPRVGCGTCVDCGDVAPRSRAAWAGRPRCGELVWTAQFATRDTPLGAGTVEEGARAIRGTRVNTVLYDNLDPAARRAMEQTSARTNGRFHQVGLRDLDGG